MKITYKIQAIIEGTGLSFSAEGSINGLERVLEVADELTAAEPNGQEVTAARRGAEMARQEAQEESEIKVKEAINQIRYGNGNGSASGTALFTAEEDGTVSLNKLPQETRDALLLLLLGFKEVQDKPSVFSRSLRRAAERSGIRAAQISKELKPYQPLLKIQGLKGSTRYGLRPQGVKRAREILQGMET